MAEVFGIGSIRAHPATMATGYIESAYLQDGARVKIPLIVVQGAVRGPALWVGSAIHGNEIAGCEVIRRLVRERLHPRALRGTLVAAPVQHPIAFLAGTHLTAHDGANINDVFPGRPTGTLTQRIAYDLFHQGVECVDALLDLHSTSIGAVSYSLVRPGGSGAAWDAQWELADAFGISVAVRPVERRAPAGGGTLHAAALYAGKPALTIELSGGCMYEEPSVRAGVTGVLNVMKYLAMLDGSPEPQTEVPVLPGRLRDRRYLTCGRGGFVRALRQIGSRVRVDEPIAAVYDMFGEDVEVVRSPIDGWVIAYGPQTGNRTVVSGDTIAFVFGP